jgi:hypothetical protein
MLEAVPGPAAQEPDIIYLRMAVHDKVTVGSLLILADTGFD